jgi:hypothetical protein
MNMFIQYEMTSAANFALWVLNIARAMSFSVRLRGGVSDRWRIEPYA